MNKARDLRSIKTALSPDPLERGELSEYFEETSDARDPHLIKREQVYGHLQGSEHDKVLLTGHTGCGKSTELVKLQEEHFDQFAFISFSLIRQASLSQASLEVLLILLIDTIVRESKEIGVTLNETALKEVYDWFSESFEINEKDIALTAQAGASADSSTTYWGKLLGLGAFLKTDIKTGARTLHKTITSENKRLPELAFLCNRVINEAVLAVREKLNKELVLVVEDLDKIPWKAAEQIFLDNPGALLDLNCKAIFTAPIWLMCTPRSGSLDGFKKVTLPMIKVVDQKGRPNDEGISVIKKLLERRMDLNLINDGALVLAIEKTGGVLRHLFEVLTTASMAATTAFNREKRKVELIMEEDVRYALNQLRSELVRRIGVVGLPDGYDKTDISVEAMFTRLEDLARNPRRIASDPISLLLLQAHTIIEYNGVGWHAVHPLIVEHLDSIN